MYQPRQRRRTTSALLVAALLAACAETDQPLGPWALDGPQLAVSAEGAIVWGPEEFTRNRGKPSFEVRVIDPTGFEAPFTMRVSPGVGSVSSASIIVDGTEIIGPNAFPLDGPVLVALPDLEPGSELSVQVRGKPGASLVLQIRGIELPTTPPVIATLQFTNELGQLDTDIVGMELDGTGRVTLAGDRSLFEYQAEVSPDGEVLAFSANPRSGGLADIYVMSVRTGLRTRLTSDSRIDAAPSWSPDSHQLVFARWTPPNGVPDLYVMNRDGSDERRLTDGSYRTNYPAWSPDGEWIAFQWVPLGFGNNQVGLIRPDGTGLRVIDTGIVEGNAPVWSDDQSRIFMSAHARVGSSTADIYEIELSSGQTRRLTLDPTRHNGDPGGKIVDGSLLFTSTPSGAHAWQIWRLDVNTLAKTQITFDGDAFYADPKRSR